MRDGRLMRAFNELVAGSCLALAGLSVITQFHPAGPTGAVPRLAQAAVALSAVGMGFRWLLRRTLRYREAIAFLVWADGAVGVVAVTMSTPEARLCTLLYMGMATGFAGLLLGRRILVAQAGFSAALIGGITGWAVLFDHATIFGLFVYYMPVLVWLTVVPLSLLVMLDRGWRAIRKTTQSAHYDPLTGLRNRRGMYNAVAAKLRRMSSGTAVVVVCDLDGFKVFNDTHGHSGGDTALSHMAQKLERLAGTDGITARIGGDELLLVTFCADDAGVSVLLDRLNLLTRGEANGATVTASVGVAAQDIAHPGFSLDDVLWAADAAMYAAKAAGGGNCVVHRSLTTSTGRVWGVQLAAALGRDPSTK